MEQASICFIIFKSNDHKFQILFTSVGAWPRGIFCRASDSRARGPVFDTQSGHLLLFLFPLIQERYLLPKVCALSTCKLLRRSKPALE